MMSFSLLLSSSMAAIIVIINQFIILYKQNVLEQVWAAEDFEVFKRLMIQKNIELQLQALQLIQQRGYQQALKPSQTPPPSKSEANEEDEIMKEVLRISKDEYEKKTKAEKKEEEVLQKKLSESFEEHER